MVSVRIWSCWRRGSGLRPVADRATIWSPKTEMVGRTRAAENRGVEEKWRHVAADAASLSHPGSGPIHGSPGQDGGFFCC